MLNAFWETYREVATSKAEKTLDKDTRAKKQALHGVSITYKAGQPFLTVDRPAGPEKDKFVS
jgi:hypothetical protein